MRETTAAPQLSPDNVGPSVVFDLALGKKLEGGMIEFDDRAYAEHLRKEGLNDAQIAETVIHFKAPGLLDTLLMRDGYYEPARTAITVVGTSNTTLAHETDYRIAHARSGHEQRYPFAKVFALTQMIGVFIGTYAYGRLAFCEATAQPLPPIGEFLTEASVASLLIIGSVALYYADPNEWKEQQAEKNVNAQFVSIIDQTAPVEPIKEGIDRRAAETG